MIRYFFSYRFQKNDASGFGECTLLRSQPMATPEDLDQVRKYLSDEVIGSVVILYWRRFEE